MYIHLWEDGVMRKTSSAVEQRQVASHMEKHVNTKYETQTFHDERTPVLSYCCGAVEGNIRLTRLGVGSFSFLPFTNAAKPNEILREFDAGMLFCVRQYLFCCGGSTNFHVRIFPFYTHAGVN